MATTQEILSGLLGAGGSLAAAYLPYEATSGEMEALKNIVSGFKTDVGTLSDELTGVSQFKPFTITTPTGTTSVAEGGGYGMQLGQVPGAIQTGLLGSAQTAAGALGSQAPDVSGIQQAALTGAESLLGQPTPTAADLYSQMQAIQAPEQERQRIALENRLAAQGRLGTQTAAYGGTPEALALEKAIQEQSAANLYQSQLMAPQLAQQQQQQAAGLFGLGSQASQLGQQMTASDIANLQNMLGAAYVPQTQQIAAMTPAVQLANISQAARQGELEALYKTGIAGLQAQAEGAGAVATLEAQRSRALADALQGLFAGGSNVASGTKSATATSPVDKLLDIILGGSDVPDDQLTRDQYFDKYGYFPEELNL